jgi:NADH-quinone oxidoreductase subunit L
MELPLGVLAVLSIIAGFVELPPALGNLHAFTNFLTPILPEPESIRGGAGTETLLAVIAGVIVLAGIYLAYVLFLRRRDIPERLAHSPVGSTLDRFWLTGWGFDWLYNRLFVWPYVWLAQINKDDFIDSIYDAIAGLFRGLNRGLSVTQTGRVRWYALGIALGAVIVLGIVVFL